MKFLPAAGVLLIAASLYVLCAPGHGVGFFEDDAMYVLAAQSLRQGRYVDFSQPTQPPEIQFLPGFPALLTPLIGWAKTDWNRLKVVPFVLSIAAGLLATILFAEWLGWPLSLLGLALFVWNPFTVLLSDLLLSEWLLLCLTLAAALLLIRLLKKPRSIRQQCALGSVLSAAVLVRPEGILLAAAAAAAFVVFRSPLRKRWAIAAVPLMVWGSWMLRNQLAAGQGSTYGQLWAFGSLSNALAAASDLIVEIFGVQVIAPGPARWVLSILGGGLLAMGFWRESRQRTQSWISLFVLPYTLVFVGLHLLWQVRDTRFYLCVLPFCVAFVLSGAKGLVEKAPRARKPAIAVGILLLVCMWFQNLNRFYSGREAVLKPFRLPRASYAEIVQLVPPTSHLFTNKGAALYLYAHRTNLPLLNPSSAEELRYQLLKNATPYVFICRQSISLPASQRKWFRIDRWLQSWPTAFSAVYNNSDEAATLYQVKPDAAYIQAYELYLEGRKLYAHGDRQGAIRRFQAALRTDSNFPGALNDYAALLLADGEDLPQARALLEKATTLRPAYPLAWLNLARLYRQAEQREEATRSMERAAQAAEWTHETELLPLINEETAKP